MAGFSACTGDCAVARQADFHEGSAIIPEMYESWKRGNRAVLAAAGNCLAYIEDEVKDKDSEG